MQKSEFFAQTFFYVLGGLVSNSQNIKAKASDMVEQAFNAAKLAADRYEQVMSATDPAVVQLFSVTPIPADATITYTADATAQLNKTPDVVKASVNPTTVRQPDDSGYIADAGVPTRKG